MHITPSISQGFGVWAQA